MIGLNWLLHAPHTPTVTKALSYRVDARGALTTDNNYIPTPPSTTVNPVNKTYEERTTTSQEEHPTEITTTIRKPHQQTTGTHQPMKQ
jgi:hypothetical protein